MIQSVTLSRLPIADPASRVAVSPAVFTQSLAAFLDTLTAEPPHVAVPERTDDAAPGKPLPHDEADGDALAWLAAMLPPPVPPSVIPLPLNAIVGAARPINVAAPPSGLSVTVPVPGDTAQPIGAPFDLAQDARPFGTGPMSATSIVLSQAAPASDVPPSPGTPSDPIAPDPTPADLKTNRALLVLASGAPQPGVPPPPPTNVTPVFAAALHEAVTAENKPARTQSDAVPLPAPPAQIEAQRYAVAATGDVQATPVDLNSPGWPHRMIERIEQMRDAADAGDTRIRLVPDALGTIEVGVRREGDTLHVQFTAEQATTARWLSDAQPRLAELAEARGIRLGGTAVDTGGGHTRDQRAPHPAPPAPVSARADPHDAAPTDTRIA